MDIVVRGTVVVDTVLVRILIRIDFTIFQEKKETSYWRTIGFV
jgi:hypothetical protein